MLNRDNAKKNFKLGITRLFVVMAIALTTFTIFSTEASAETRSLKLYYIHTKERANIVYKKNGRYVASGLKKINRFLRDWRRNEPTKMDPKLLDLVWEAYRKSGSRKYIHVVSAYRSPSTNAMLRKTRGGQAKKSQHMLGKAMDFYIPGVSVKKLREIGFKLAGGGVGYYPRSGVPFVHLDTGNVRAWPRMSRKQLTRLFPKGGTLHLPPDGKPLPGYKQALAKYKARKRSGGSVIDDNSSRKSSGGLLTALFGGRDEEEDNAQSVIASATATRPRASTNNKAVNRPPAPGTLLASLPSNALPVPISAPRTRNNEQQQSVPVPITPQATTPPVSAEAITTEPQPNATPDFTIPIPEQRPAVLIARADAPIERRSAVEIEQALTETTGQEQQTDDNNISIAQKDTLKQEKPTTELAYALPIPSAAPRRADTQSDAIPSPNPLRSDPKREPAPTVDVAYAPPQRGIEFELPIPAQRVENSVPGKVKSGKVKSGRIIADKTSTATLDTEVTTTQKSARPDVSGEKSSTPSPKPVIIPADQIDQSRFGSWRTTKTSLTQNGRAEQRPDFIQNATRVAPDIVYTAGFSKTPPPNTNSFSGNAVTFLAVAKFNGGTKGKERGEPLHVSIPN